MDLARMINDGAGRAADSQRVFPYVIAEAGVNHEGDMEIAKRLIEQAAAGGAHAIKFQSYKAETLASKASPYYWDITKETTRSQYELFKKYDKFWKNEYEQLKSHCDRIGIDFLCTPFDLESARFLADLIKVYKIASADITNRPFIEYICGFNKPILLSTGASFLYEIEEAVEWVESGGLPVGLLHCVLNYPTRLENANLGRICALAGKFPQKLIGYSDHTVTEDMEPLVIAAALGAAVLEKHFTHDKTLSGNDHYHAMDQKDLSLLMSRLQAAFSMIGSGKTASQPSEEPARKHARRSLVAVRRIARGRRVTREDLTWKRPADGISPKHIGQVVGMFATLDIEEDEQIKWEMLHE